MNDQMDLAWWTEVLWHLIAAFFMGSGLALLWAISRNAFDIKLSASYLRGVGTSLEDIARSLGRIARALETLAANSQTYVALRRQRGD